MEQSLFRLLCLCAALLSLLVIAPIDFTIDLPRHIVILDVAFGLCALVLYRQARRGRYLRKTLLLCYLVDLSLCWFGVNGSQGSIPFFYFTGFVYALIFFRGRERWYCLAAAMGDIALLLLAEYLHPEWIIGYPGSASRLIDLMIAIGLTGTSCSIMLGSLLSSYDREHRDLKTANADLEQSIAERVEAEQSLRQNRELLHSIIDGTSDCIYAKDAQGRYILINSAAAQLTGKSVEEILGRDDWFLFRADEARQITELDREILRTGAICHPEHQLTNGGGQTVVVHATKGPLRDEDGRVVGVFGISRDVTDSRRVEEEIRLLNAELDLRVTERTLRLEAAIKEQEAFCYSVSHDLRAPLRHINSYSAILVEECAAHLPPEGRDYLERIRSSSRSMGQLIDDLLELSKIGRSQMQKSSVDLSEMVWKICRRLQNVEPERRVEFQVATELVVHGDRVLLHQALVNLLDNAWKYTKTRNAARIEVGRDGEGDQAVYFVRDNGVGFDMAYRDKLFGAFQRLHGPEYEGTGIGLATVKRIVKRHGGRVWAEGAVDEGATIYFTLPGSTARVTPGALIGFSGPQKLEFQASR
ncbi:hypothetical protein GMLC_03820 [Geomonas limicola]|uniref:histidine kinase n=1 Tax=Geomonas limicola TaxID=2740186 RepID=A0A6V8N5A9_9BACT|nr:ATP-binding protein [Geomonas limicola]GFO66803.1 hypothetical protein GMLC_03820 [Geomonas limicola]